MWLKLPEKLIRVSCSEVALKFGRKWELLFGH